MTHKHTFWGHQNVSLYVLYQLGKSFKPCNVYVSQGKAQWKIYLAIKRHNLMTPNRWQQEHIGLRKHLDLSQHICSHMKTKSFNYKLILISLKS